MGTFEALILGIVQGATEFLPISSSGHLVLTGALLGVEEGGLLVEITLHTATFLAVVVYFRGRIAWMAAGASRRDEVGRRARAWILWLLVGTLPAAAVGIAFRSPIEMAFRSPRSALLGLLATGAILLSTRWSVSRRTDPAGPAALIMGAAQALAILPGISRSGSTIAAGMWSGVEKSEAAEFSFLLSLPAIGGAALLQGADLLGGGVPGAAGMLPPLAVGFAAAFAAGYAAIAGLLEVLRRRGLVPFAWYCWALGVAGLLLV
ncbi:MAG: undecaprenyl-diphosphate phosphatase [bacterium]